MHLSEQEIRDWVGDDAVFFRGKEYWLKKHVQTLQEVSPQEIRAVVLGSQSYQVSVRFKNGNISSHCSCPYEWGTCKHVAAVLLQWSHQTAVAAVSPWRTRQVPAAPVSSPKPYGTELLAGPSGQDVRLRVELNSLSGINLSSKGTKVKIKVMDGQGRKLGEIGYLRDFVDRSQGYSGNVWDTFNDSQQYVLNLVASFQQSYNETFLKPFQLSMLLNAFSGLEGLEGVELYAGAKRPVEVSAGQTLLAKIIMGLTKKRKLWTILQFPDPQDPLRHLYPDIFDGRPLWCYLEDRCRFLRLPKGIDRRLLALLGCNTKMIFDKDAMPGILKTIEALKSTCTVVCESPELEQLQAVSAALSMHLTVDYDGKYLSIAVKAVYGEHVLTLAKLLDRREFALIEKGGRLLNIKRDLAKEAAVLGFLLEDCGLEVALRAEVLRTSRADCMAELIYEKLAHIAHLCEISISPNVEKIFHLKDDFESFVRIGDADGINWFEYDIGFSLDGGRQEVSFRDIQSQLVRGKNYVRLNSGEFVRLDLQKHKTLEDFIREQGAVQGRLTSAHLPYLMACDQEGHLKVQWGAKAREVCEKLKQFSSIAKTKPPQAFKGVLRDYQALGLDWLEFLKEFQFGGILADDMGLGKTVQVAALLLKCQEQGVQAPSLVVCPTTLVLNWQAELRKFAPDLKVLVLTGKDRRQRISEIGSHHVVLVSYAIIRRDIELYQDLQFHYIVLDEAQHIKNRHTLNARMTKSLKGANRLVLTGTPIENSIADLWSIFDFLMPGYLGKYEFFRDFYEQPIVLAKDKLRLEQLVRKLKPFLLRRLKKDVVRELPPKVEQVSLCEMESVQKRAYAAMMDLGRRQVMDAFASKGFNQSRMLILTVLLRLRQICCHPRLAGVEQGPKFSASAKLNLLRELLDEALSAGHRVLVFSQFVEMLDIISDDLRRKKIGFERLDGRVKDRAAVVERFNGGLSSVFLLSLKVGGVGLNLTSADTVILFEPWWNPAVETQAIDRAYRIGQDKQVMAYKLICKGTIEEKMLDLQKRKKDLVDALVQSEETLGKTLGWEDVKFILDI